MFHYYLRGPGPKPGSCCAGHDSKDGLCINSVYGAFSLQYSISVKTATTGVLIYLEDSLVGVCAFALTKVTQAQTTVSFSDYALKNPQ